ncbi:MAG: OmpA family protein [Bdellovibrionales bacterium]|nr:OmpA family protein [Bdellovibrionales bacterium]
MLGGDEHGHSDEDHGDDEIWLISYSDLMTLLFGFFVLMYVFASTKTGDAEKVREGLAKSFGGSYVAPYEELADQLKQQAESGDHPILGQIDVQKPTDGMEITFRSNLLFDSGSSELRAEVRETMKMIAELISDSVNDAEILVGGHTDDSPIHTSKFPSNWELSTARAASVVREFIGTGYDPKALVALGYAETRPAYPNRDESGKPIPENRERNRRVVIKVVAPGIVKQPTESTAYSAQQRAEAKANQAAEKLKGGQSPNPSPSPGPAAPTPTPSAAPATPSPTAPTAPSAQ